MNEKVKKLKKSQDKHTSQLYLRCKMKKIDKITKSWVDQWELTS